MSNEQNEMIEVQDSILNPAPPDGRYKIKGTPYVKNHGAVINTSTDDYQKRLNAIRQQEKINENEKRLNELDAKLNKILKALGIDE